MLKLKTILQSKTFAICLFVGILVLAMIRLNWQKSQYEDGVQQVTGTIVVIQYQEDCVSLVLQGREKIQVFYYESLSEKYHLGDQVIIVGQMKTPSKNTIPNTFNYQKYLASRKIKKIMTAETITLKEKNRQWAFKIKNMINTYLDTFKSSKFIKTFIVGNREDFENYAFYQDLGVAHIFALSGMHISLLVGLISRLLKRIPLKMQYGIILAFLLFYLFLTNYMASIVRSFFMTMGRFINNFMGNKWDEEQIYYLALATMLLWRPEYLIDLGFQYSSIISFFLIKYRIIIQGSYFRKSFYLSFIAFMSSLPILINTNYEINILTIINNLVIVPIITFGLYPLALLTFILPFLDRFYFFLTSIFEEGVKYLFSFKIIVPKITIWGIIIFYLLWILFLNTYHRRYLLSIAVFFGLHLLSPIIDYRCYVTYLDVSQGDAAIIKFRDQTIMIDTGGQYYREFIPSILTFLRSIGAYDIDYLILTHGDYDHLGEAKNIIANYQVQQVIFNSDGYNANERELIQELEQRHIRYRHEISNLKLKKIKLTFLNTELLASENDNSQIIYFSFFNYRFLFMGDASKIREEAVLKRYTLPNITFLKVGHHGSNTSTSQDLIDQVNPEYTIISVGKNNRYGHPHIDTLKRLASSHIKRTDKDGSIQIILSPHQYLIKTFAPT